jgi:hypothetical protein
VWDKKTRAKRAHLMARTRNILALANLFWAYSIAGFANFVLAFTMIVAKSSQIFISFTTRQAQQEYIYIMRFLC